MKRISTHLMKISLLLVLIAGLTNFSTAQNTVTIGGTDTRSDAVLWLVPNNNQGLILPVTTRSGFTPSEAGMMIYDPSASSVFFWDGGNWVDVSSGTGGQEYILQINGANLELLEGGAVKNSIPISTFHDGVDDADNDPTNELQNISQILTVGNDAGAQRITNLQDPAANQDAATKGYVDNAIALIPIPIVSLNDLQDVLAGSPVAGQVLQFDGSNWVPVALPGGGDLLATNNLSELTNVATARTNLGLGILATLGSVSDAEITGMAPSKLLGDGAASGEVLQWNGTTWVPVALPGGGDLLAINNLSELTNVTTARTNLGLGILATLGSVSDAEITGMAPSKLLGDGAASGEVLQWNGTTWVPVALPGGGDLLAANNLSDLADIPTSRSNLGLGGLATLSSISDLEITDVDPSKLLQSGAGVGEVLQWNGTNWVPVTLPGGGDLLAANNLSDLADIPTARTNLGLGALAILNTVSDTEITDVDPTKLSQSGAAVGEVLQWNGTNWVPVTSPGGGDLLAANNLSDLADIPTSRSNLGLGGLATLSSVSDLEITDVDPSKLLQSGAGVGEVLQWNGTNWVPVTLPGGGDLLAANNLSDLADIPTSRSNLGLGGLATLSSVSDLEITDVDPSKILQSGAGVGEVLQWNGANWVPVTLAASGDMLQATYDINTNNIVDDAEAVGGLTSANLLDRTNHTGTQLSTTISDFSTATDTRIGLASVQALADVNAVAPSVNDVLQFDGAEWIPSALVAGDMLAATYDPGGIAADVYDRANHTGTQLSTTISDFSAAADTRIGLASVQALADVNAAAPSVNDVLQFDGAEWVPSALVAGDMLAATYDPGGIAADVYDRANHTGTQAITTIDPVGGGQRAILGSNDATNSWVTGAPDQVLTTDGVGNLTFVDKSSFIDVTTQTGILIGNGSNITGVVPTSGVIYRGDGTTLIPSNIFDDGVNVGIGTVTPASPLQVVGVSRLDGNIISGGEIQSIAPNPGASAIFNLRSNAANRWYLTNDGATENFFISYENLNIANSEFMIDRGTRNIGIRTATPRATLDIVATDAIIIPAGTTAQQPGTPVAGMLRFNSDSPGFEGYDGGSWVGLGATSNSLQSAYNGGNIIQLDGINEFTINKSDASQFIATNEAGNVVNFNSNIDIIANGEYRSNGTRILASGINTLAVGTGAGFIGTDNTFVGTNSGAVSDGTTFRNSFFGHNSGSANISGIANTYLGTWAGGNATTGSNNTFVGSDAAFNLDTGSDNTFVGTNTGPTNVNGNSIVLIGAGSDVGVDNLTNATAIGTGAVVNNSNQMVLGATGTGIQFDGELLPAGAAGTAGQVLTSAGPGATPTWAAAAGGWGLTGNAGTVDGTDFIGTTDNVALNIRVNNLNSGRIDPAGPTFFGYQAGEVNTSTNSTGFGYWALQSNTTGVENVAVGIGALFSNTVGFGNSGIGAFALQVNDGAWNTATGNYALGNNIDGNFNSAFGRNSIVSNTSGSSNSALGYQSLVTNTTGSDNTAIGANADVATPALTNATAIGANSVVDASNKMVLGAVGTSVQFDGELLPAGAAGTAGQVLTSQGPGATPIWAAGGGGWSLNGNAGTTAGTDFLGTTDLQDLVISTNGTERLRIEGDGSSPDLITIPTVGGAEIYMTSVGANAEIVADFQMNLESLGGDLLVAAPAGNVLLQPSAGNVGIGLISPQNLMHVDGGGGLAFSQFTNAASGSTAGDGLLVGLNGLGEGFISYQEALDFKIQSNGVNSLWIDATGQVGVGSSAAPLQALDVNGNINISTGSGFYLNNIQFFRYDLASSNMSFGQASGGSITSGVNNNIFGHQAGSSLQDGSDNIIVGGGAGSTLVSGSNNVFVGRAAGNATESNFNTFVGGLSGIGNTSGQQNTFIGESAGLGNTSGSGNVIIGRRSGLGNTTGGSNLIIGNSSGSTNSAGNQIVLIGNNSDVGVDGLINAIAIGQNSVVSASNRMVLGQTGTDIQFDGELLPAGASGTAGQVLTSQGPGATPIWSAAGGGWGLTGNTGTVDGTDFIGTTDNVALNIRVNNLNSGRIDPAGITSFGYQAGEVNSTNNLTGFGFRALASNTTGLNNTALGYEALAANTTGTNNTAGGINALNQNTTGFSNTATGSEALFLNTGGTENAALGQAALRDNDSGSFNVAIGNSALRTGTIGNSNIAIGFAALFRTDGVANIGIGNSTLDSDLTGQFNIGIGFDADVSVDGLTNAIAIGANSVVDASNKMVLGAVGTSVQFDGELLPAGVAGTAGQVLTSAGPGATPTWAAAGGGWGLSGNAGTTGGTDFIGTTDAQPLEIKVENIRVMRYEYDAGAAEPSPNILGGHPSNSADVGVEGATIAGGGFTNANIASGDWASIGGGRDNVAGAASNGRYSTIGGGASNRSLFQFSTVGGGRSNNVSARGATIPGGMQLLASSMGMTAVGTANENTAFTPNAWVDTEPIFVVGNGEINPGTNAVVGRSNALTILKNGNIGISNSTPQVGLVIATTDAVSLPAGTTAQQPAALAAGMLRFNTDNTAFEGYDGVQWNTLNTGGGSALIDNPGTNNLFAGNAFSTTGQNVAIFGANSGTVNTGNNNTFMGANAGQNNAAAIENTFIGAHAGRSNTGSGFNVFVGKDAGRFFNDVGDINTFIGYQSGLNAGGFGNTFLGGRSGENTTGDINTFIGQNAGRNNTSGNNNTFIGQNAGTGQTSGISNQIGDQNILIGVNADVGSDGLSGAIAIGNNAVVSSSNSMVLGQAGTSIGIGTNSPAELFHVESTAPDAAMIRLINNSTTTSGFRTSKARGTQASPSGILTNDRMGVFEAQGYDGDSYELGAWIQFRATDNWSNTSRGTEISFIGAANGSTSYFTRMTIANTGNVTINNDLSVLGTLSKGSGTFKIDHPVDPENKYLYHSFVESPDMMNVYNGNITTDTEGHAVVELPEYFEALNKDFRYQLTVIGTFAQAIIAEKIKNNQFVILSDKPGVEVSWQITGIRKDPYAEKNRVNVEVEKEDENKGKYLHSKAYGMPSSYQIGANKKEN